MKTNYEDIKKILMEYPGIHYTSFEVQPDEGGEVFAVENILIHSTGTYLIFETDELDTKKAYHEMLKQSFYFRANQEITSNLIAITNTPNQRLVVFMENRARREETNSVYEIVKSFLDNLNPTLSDEDMWEIKNKIKESKEDYLYVPENAIVSTRLGKRILIENEKDSEEKFVDSMYLGFLGGYYVGVPGFLNRIKQGISFLTFGLFGVFILQGLMVLFAMDKNPETGYFYKPKITFMRIVFIVLFIIGYFFVLSRFLIPFMGWVLGLISKFAITIFK